MNRVTPHLTNLPDELLLIILRKLESVDVLYSLLGVNKDLDRIVRDPWFTTAIKFIRPNGENFDENEVFIGRFCSIILPKIHHLIKWLKLDSTLMERLLQTADYPNLSQLDIFISHEMPILYLNGESSLVPFVKKTRSASEIARSFMVMFPSYSSLTVHLRIQMKNSLRLQSQWNARIPLVQRKH